MDCKSRPIARSIELAGAICYRKNDIYREIDMTTGQNSRNRQRNYGFLLAPDFSMMCFSSAIEPLRAANRLAGEELYRWYLYSPDGGPVLASNRIAVLPDSRMGDERELDGVFVCAGIDAHQFDDPQVLNWLVDQAQRGIDVGSITTGAFILARAGLLDRYRCTTHWESLPTLAEAYPEVDATPSLFEIDGPRATCSGGTAAMDLMLHLIGTQHDSDLAMAVANQFIHGRIRASEDRQPMTEQIRLRTRAPKLAAAIDVMHNHIERPLTTAEIGSRIGVSCRQLERLFQHHLECAPRHYYMRIRLEHARVLLLETGLSLLNVALASGFVSQSHFGACYRRHFGCTPREERMHEETA